MKLRMIFLFCFITIIATFIINHTVFGEFSSKLSLLFNINPIDSFVHNAHFPAASNINILINNSVENVQVFKLSFGKAQDCISGCFYSDALGIKHNNKIGWVSINNYEDINTSSLPFYDFDNDDSYLFTEQFRDLLEKKDSWTYQYAYLPLLAKDSDVPSDVLLSLAKSLSTFIQPQLATNLLSNEAVIKNREIIMIISNLPEFQGDAYKEVRAQAKSILNEK